MIKVSETVFHPDPSRLSQKSFIEQVERMRKSFIEIQRTGGCVASDDKWLEWLASMRSRLSERRVGGRAVRLAKFRASR